MEEEKTVSFNFSTLDEMLEKLRAYLEEPDDDAIRLKNKIKSMLMSCPELLWALNAEEYQSQLFNADGTLNETGEWDVYFGENSLIRPFLFIPETQDIVANYLCYQISTGENMRYNDKMKYLIITFTILIHENNSIDKETGIARHDLIASILREKLAWSSVGLADAIPIFENESVTDNNYITKVLKYQIALPNNLVVTKDGTTAFVNKCKE